MMRICMSQCSRPATSRRILGALLGVLATLCCFAPASAASDVTPRGSDDAFDRAYSALVCLQHAARQVGAPFDAVDLVARGDLAPGHVPTAETLAAVGRRQGLYTLAAQDLNTAQLKHLLPAVLEVRGSRYSAGPDHFVVCTAIHDGHAQIFNPPAAVIDIPLETLEARWRGAAVSISARPIAASLAAWRWEAYRAPASLGALALLLVLAARWRQRAAVQMRSGRWLRSPLQAGALLIVSLVIGATYRIAIAGTFLVHPPEAAASRGPDPFDFLSRPDVVLPERVHPKEVSLAESLSLYSRRALFLDARDLDEFSRGHIRGAACCPASDVARLSLNMAGIPLDRQLVVYCINTSCGKAHYLASALAQRGFSRVLIYDDGWDKWTGEKEQGPPVLDR